jgi:hypothetical protein
MPKSWTTNKQFTWLKAQLPEFQKAQGDGTVQTYLKQVSKSFLKEWPITEHDISQNTNEKKRKDVS